MDITSLAQFRSDELRSRIPSMDNRAGDKELKEACQDFESIFVKQLLDGMRKTINKTGLLSGGLTEEIYEDMLYSEYAREISRSGNLGLADLLYNQLKGAPETSA